MTAGQTAMYFAEFGKLRDVLRARLWSTAKIEAHRSAITLKALGRAKSSKQFTNADLDKVLAVIKAETAPADFDAQMRLQDMPEKRHALVMGRIHALSLSVQLEPGLESSYVAGIAHRMFGERAYERLTVEQLGQIEGVLRRRLKQLHLTLEQINEVERTVAASAAARLQTLAPVFAAKPAAALVAGEDF